MRSTRIAVTIAAVATALLAGATPATAAAQVEILWTATTGLGATGGDSIQAANGDQLTATVYVTADSAGISSYAVSVEFDQALDDELDLVSAVGLVPVGFIPLGGNPVSTQESTLSQEGNVLTFSAGDLTPGPVNTTFAVGEIVLEVKNVAADGTDVAPGFFNVGFDAIFDNSFIDITGSTVLIPASVELAPQVEIVWTATTGSGASGLDTIEAENGDELTATVYVTAPSNGIQVYSVSVEFDQALDDELDLVSAVGLVPSGFSPLGGNPGSTQESTVSQEGNVLSFAGSHSVPGPVDTAFAVGEIVLAVKDVAADGTDVASGFFNIGIDGIFDNSSVEITGSTVLLSASVDPAAPRVPFAADDVLLTAGSEPLAVAIADVDGDGRPDALTASCNDDTVAWYQNDGASPPGLTQYVVTDDGTADCPNHVRAADLDGDGDLDVLSTSEDGKVLWYENDGTPLDGGWTARQIDLRSFAEAVRAADIDGDGDLDVVAAFIGTALEIAWYRNDGGTPLVFATQSDIASGIGFRSLATGDLDRDGDVDVVSAGGSSDLSWYENNGDGSSWTTRALTHSLSNPWSSSVGDVNGDGAPDILATGASSDLVAWYESDGGAPPSFTERVVSDDGFADSPQAALAADVDADGDMDVLGAAGNDDKIAWYENTTGDGTSWTPRVISTSVATFLSAPLAPSDFDGDGDLDVLSVDFVSDELVWHENQTIHRSALFDATRQTTVESVAGATPFVADVDGDGDLDLVGSVNADDDVVWWNNTAGDGSAWTKVTVDAGFTTGANRASAADLDGNGTMDVIAKSASGTTLAWWSNQNGLGTSWSTARVVEGVNESGGDIEAVDLDRDGDLDLVSQNVQNEVAWYENVNGDGLTWSHETIGTGLGTPGAATVGDVDGDGDVDVIWNHRPSTTHDTVWYQNDGAGGGWTERLISNSLVSDLVAVDFDRDGDLDLVRSSNDIDTVAWDENDGTPLDGGWTTHVIGTGADNVKAVVVVDFDADGDLDVASASANDDTVEWFENDDGTGTSWTRHVIREDADFAHELAVGDVDGDGDPDLVYATAIEATLAWIPNEGGQFALPTADTAYLGMVDGRTDDVLAIEAIHRGRAGDTDVELTRIELHFQDDAATDLSSGEADALFSKIDLLIDDGSGVYEPGSDTTSAASASAPYSLTNGVLTLSFSDADPNARIQHGTPVTYFVVPVLEPTASAASPNQFRVTHVTESSPGAEDRDHDIPLSFEFLADTSSGLVQALATGADADSDGIDNEVEADTWGTDPLNADTDGDAADDGVEVAAGSDPLDTDSDDDGLQDGPEIALGSDPLDEDTDGDFVCDGGLQVGVCTSAGDNCPLQSNAGQTNSDAFPAGDFCQCGNVDGVRGITAADVERVREFVVGATPSGSFDADFCDVRDDGSDGTDDCNVADVFLLERAVAGETVTLEDACDAWFTPSP